jgi:DNA-binding NarL/FixJ family response regulator
VLVADDARAIARRIAELLRQELGATIVGPAHDGEEALRLLREERVDACILDFDMPVKSGLDVLRELRAAASTCAVVVLTNHDEPEIRARCLALGAKAVLHKARDVEQLPGVLAAHVEPPTTAL